MSTANHTVLKQDKNIWCTARAGRLAVIIDGEGYYRAFREAVLQARRSILILGWDIDTRLRLVRERTDDDMPDQLGELLYRALRKNHELEVNVLVWDWAVLYAAERQWLPLYNLQWRKHRRLHFELDDHCPFGASQHQKIVVIDDKLAFIGGFDLSRDRWDTPDHAPDDPRRINTNGDAYRPFHDLQAAVTGEAAAVLGDLVRERWQLATGRTLDAPPDELPAPWPRDLDVAVRDIDIAYARSAPELDGQPARREIQALLTDAIDSARHAIYIENEYLSSERIGEALSASIEQPEGPDIIVVLPEKTGNWLEQNTMDVLRWRLLSRLREADHHGRLYICYPQHTALGDEYISLHSKLLIADDRLMTLGSANLSNRSMGFDTECNLVVEAHNDETRRMILAVRNRLLAEHLGTTVEQVAERTAEHTSLIAAIDSLRGNTRSLEPLDGEVDETVESLLPDHQLVDPERPVSAGEMADLMMPPEERKSTLRQLAPALLMLGLLAALAAAWRWTPLSQWLDTDSLQQLLTQISGSPLALLAIPAAYTAAGLLSVPLTLLVVVTALVFGPWTGFLYAMSGALLSALCNFTLGRWLASNRVRQMAGSRLNRLSEKLGKRGILAIVTLRLVPVAPFGVVNLVAGATHVRLRDFLLGSAIGLAPGLLGITFFSHQVAATIRSPEPGAFALLAGIAGALVAAGWLLYRWADKRDDDAPSSTQATRST
jgi:phosphatidylserine/phosphatidylglycerophosphate/cardiolipin synthase-like enzyme/uncharacterized membrane protein YdjX (TVP38/TMEM64 family)